MAFNCSSSRVRGRLFAAEIVRRDIDVCKYVVAVADGPMVRQRAAIDLADVVEVDFAGVFFIGEQQFDADQIGVVGVEVESGLDAGVSGDQAVGEFVVVFQGIVPR